MSEEIEEKKVRILDHLCEVADILRDLGVPFWITGGTLLGAIREGDIIAGDTDWDIDCLSEAEPMILAAKERFHAAGMIVTHPYRKRGRSLFADDTKLCDSRLIRIARADRVAHGDIYLHTLFSDGILRRYCFKDHVFYNPKMAFPAWFIEGTSTVQIRSHSFPAPREPVRIIEKIYGPMWSTPLERHHTPKGYNFGGAILDADLESVIEFCLKRGWNGDYSDRPHWPQPVQYTNSKAAQRWIKSHEVLAVHLLQSKDARGANLPPSALQAQLHYRLLCTRLARELRALAASAKANSADPTVAMIHREVQAIGQQLKVFTDAQTHSLRRRALSWLKRPLEGGGAAAELQRAARKATAYWTKSNDTYVVSKRYYERVERALKERVIPLVGPQTSLLDVGCGDGRYALAWAAAVAEVRGIDISTALIAQANTAARSNGFRNATFECVNIVSDNFASKAFDVVMCMGVTSTIVEEPTFRNLCVRLAKAVGPDGWLIMRDTLSTNRYHELALAKKRPSTYRSKRLYIRQFVRLGFMPIMTIRLSANPSKHRENYLIAFKRRALVNRAAFLMAPGRAYGSAIDYLR